MNETGNMRNRYLSYYRHVIVVVAVFLFYSNIPNYLYLMEWASTPPKIYIIALTILVLPFFVEKKVSKYFVASPLLIWSVVYLGIAILWFIPSTQSDDILRIFSRRVAAVFFVISIFFMFLEDPRSIEIGRWTILLCVLLAVVNNLYEMTHPFSFVPPLHEFSNPGRSAGLYMNANQSGAAMVLGMILSIGLVPPKYRVPYASFVFLGVVTTFSRAAILGWFVVSLVLIYQKTLRIRECMVGTAIFGVSVFIAVPVLLDFLSVERGISLGNLLDRLDWFANLGRLSIDISQEDRQTIARLAWDLFASHPFFGNGIGSTEMWSEKISTHNIYLYFMADYGIIGAFVLPALVVSITSFARKEARWMAIPFGIFAVYWGFFSHNMLDERYFLISIACMAAVSVSSCHRSVVVTARLERSEGDL